MMFKIFYPQISESIERNCIQSPISRISLNKTHSNHLPSERTYVVNMTPMYVIYLIMNPVILWGSQRLQNISEQTR